MGNSSSIPKPTAQEIEELTKTTHFNKVEINKLYDAFLKIASCKGGSDGMIQPEEFYESLAITNEEYGKKVFEAFDTKKDGNLTFSEYIVGVSQLCERATVEEKAKFCFGLYDNDHSGTISKHEFMSIIEASLGQMPGADPALVRQIGAQLFKEIDRSGDNKITHDEFLKAANKNNNIVKCVEVHVEHIFAN